MPAPQSTGVPEVERPVTLAWTQAYESDVIDRDPCMVRNRPATSLETSGSLDTEAYQGTTS